MIYNKMRGLPVVAVKTPGFGDSRKNNLQDLAVLTGAHVFSEEMGDNIEKVEMKQLGKAAKVEISSDSTLILDGAGTKEAIKEHCESINEALSRSTSDYEKEKLKERVGKLLGGVAVLKIGGATEVEVNERKDLVVDALNATRAAVAEGIVPGGGVALLYASRDLDAIKLDNHDQQRGLEILKIACRVPCQIIADNAGAEGTLIVGKLLEQKDTQLGYDAANEKFVNMIKAGIVDPLKVVRTALVDASSVASLLATTEAMIVDESESS